MRAFSVLNEDRRKAYQVIDMGCVIKRAIVVQILGIYLWCNHVQAAALSEASSAMFHSKASDSELVILEKKNNRHKSYLDYNDDVVRIVDKMFNLFRV